MSVISIQTKTIDDLSTVSTVDTSTAKIIVQSDGSTVAMGLDDTIDLFIDEASGFLIEYPLYLLDGTSATYKKVMRQWFLAQGIDTASPDAETLTALCDQWYALTRDQWSGYTEFYQPDVSAVTYGTKGGDNADLTCTPSTDTVEGTDDYAGLPLFACVDCNWEMYEDASGNAEILITAIDGITSNFKRYDTSVYVGVLVQSGYLGLVDYDDTYRIVYSSYADATYGSALEPVPAAVKPDGTFREWCCYGKYDAALNDSGGFTCCAGVPGVGNRSLSVNITASHINGTAYSGYTSADRTYIWAMVSIKYGSLTVDGLLQGCHNTVYQYAAQITEEGVSRIYLASGAADYLEVGMAVYLGSEPSSTAVQNADLSGWSGIGIKSIESATVTVDDEDVEYTLVTLDTDDTYDITADETYLMVCGWITGTTDAVLGNDGCPTSCTDYIHPYKIQGIEMDIGKAQPLSDIVLSLYADDDGTYVIDPLICRASASQSVSSYTAYEQSGIIKEQYGQGSVDAWIKKNSYSNGLYFPITVDGSSSTYTRDSINDGTSSSATTGYREMIVFGGNVYPSPSGLSFVNANHGVSNTYWDYGSRLSCNGNRGAWSA